MTWKHTNNTQQQQNSQNDECGNSIWKDGKETLVCEQGLGKATITRVDEARANKLRQIMQQAPSASSRCAVSCHWLPVVVAFPCPAAARFSPLLLAARAQRSRLRELFSCNHTHIQKHCTAPVAIHQW